jgi:hypothetical protein
VLYLKTPADLAGDFFKQTAGATPGKLLQLHLVVLHVVHVPMLHAHVMVHMMVHVMVVMHVVVMHVITVHMLHLLRCSGRTVRIQRIPYEIVGVLVGIVGREGDICGY